MAEIVVAYDRNGVIGGGNKLPWEGMLPCDMAHFKELTRDRPVIMGRNTWDSIPERFRPLDDGRTNIVVSMSLTALKGAFIARSPEEALEMAGDTAMVIGGAQLYEATLPFVDTIHATEIEVNVLGGDAHFPLGSVRNHPDWVEQPGSADVHFPHGKNQHIHTFVTYLRRNPIIELDRSE